MSIKLIVTDLDGTFMNSNHVTIPQENIEAFRKANEMGVKVAVASGRTKILADNVVEQLPFLDYLITSNGAVTYDMKTGKVVCSTLLDNSQSNKIFDNLKDYNLIYEIYFKGDCYMNEKSYGMFDTEHVSPHIHDLLKDFIKPVPSLSEFIGNEGIEKLNILSLTGEERIEIEEKVRKTGDVAFASSFPVTKGKNGNLEMTGVNATKGFAVKGLANALEIGKENIMCFGDSENDCSMLEFAEYSFAMANGTELVKNTAKYVTDTNDNGGVAKAVAKYVLNKSGE
ncbi:MAG: HAD family phosphatase [Clostridia bacterium]|nr:HAD family phosphatase [Clostridia bacterium]